MNARRSRIMGPLAAFMAGIFLFITGCRTGAVPFDFEKAHRRIDRAISSGEYETADRLLAEVLTEAGGGAFLDAFLLKRAFLNAKMGRYAESTDLIDQLLLEYPDSSHRDSALSLRQWVESKQGETHNKSPEPSVAPARQVHR
jgi:hypothetical protein